MFSASEKKTIGQLLFDAWTKPSVATELLDQPDATLAARGITDRHGRKFVVLMDTDNTMNLIVPWLPDDLRRHPDRMSPEDRAGQVGGMLRIVWDKADVDLLFELLKAVWKDTQAATRLLNEPRATIERNISKKSVKKLDSRRIVAHEDSEHVVHFVVPLPPAEIAKAIEDLYCLRFEVMCSASFCLCRQNGDDGKGGYGKGR